MFGMGLCENLEGRFQVSVWRVFCDSWGKLVSVLVSYCCSFAFFFLWIYYDVPWLFGRSWLHPFRSVFDLLLLRLREEICHVDTINVHGGTSLIRSASYAEPNAVSNAIGMQSFTAARATKRYQSRCPKSLCDRWQFLCDERSGRADIHYWGTCIAMCGRNLAAPSPMEVINHGQACTEG